MNNVELYDIILTTGPYCRSSYYIQVNNLKRFTSPFDWIGGLTFNSILHFIKTDFKDVFETIWECFDNDRRIWYDTKNGIRSMHNMNFLTPDLFREKLKQRWEKTKIVLTEGDDILLFSNRNVNLKDFEFFLNELCNLYKGNFTIINVIDFPKFEKKEIIINNRSKLINYSFADSFPQMNFLPPRPELEWKGNCVFWNQIMKTIALKEINNG
jgi:hypothetical protein